MYSSVNRIAENAHKIGNNVMDAMESEVPVNPFMPGVPLKGKLANSADPDQTPHNAASDQGLYCLH